MKKIKFVLSVSIIIAISCSENPILEDSNCEFKNIVLDTTDSKSSLNDILGEWTLQSFVNLADCSVESEPIGFPLPAVEISFLDSGKITGHSGAEFTGNYSFLNSKVCISHLLRPELPESKPKWADRFYKATQTTSHLFVKNSMLFIFYEKSTQVMVLKSKE